MIDDDKAYERDHARRVKIRDKRVRKARKKLIKKIKEWFMENDDLFYTPHG